MKIFLFKILVLLFSLYFLSACTGSQKLAPFIHIGDFKIIQQNASDMRLEGVVQDYSLYVADNWYLVFKDDKLVYANSSADPLSASIERSEWIKKQLRDPAQQIEIKGLERMPRHGGCCELSSQRVREIVESDLNDLKAAILQDNKMLQALPGEFIEPEVINKVMIPKIIQTKYPELSHEEVEEIREYVLADSVIKNSEIKEVGNKRFVRMAGKFVNIEDLHIDLIDRVNPFQKAFEVLSKSVTAKLLKVIQETIDAGRIQMTDEEAVILYRDKIGPFMKKTTDESRIFIHQTHWKKGWPRHWSISETRNDNGK